MEGKVQYPNTGRDGGVKSGTVMFGNVEDQELS